MPKIVIELNDKKFITLNVGDEYNLSGAKAYIKSIFGKEEIKVESLGNVDTSKIDNYVITYTASSKGMKKTSLQVIQVLDRTSPKITIKGNAKACQNNKIIDINAEATDNYDGDLTDKMEYRFADDNLYISVIDSSKNRTEEKSKIDFIDSEVPILTLNGAEVIYLNKDEKYSENGATATDSCDGDISKQIKTTGTVDTSKEGEYYITYSITDSYGNKVQKTRRVVVVAKEENTDEYVSNGNIYLTFDDGPGVYTEEYLKVLAKYNVKATFFVTGQFSKYYNLIAEEYKEGHTIGIHTYSHKWSIYESVDTYLEDFNKIDKIVYDQIHEHVKYFRFPGGSSNTVSRKYCKNIMTDLAKIMQDKGYVYFDWTFDSGDTVKGKNTKEEIIKTVKSYLKGNGDYIILMHDIKKSSLEALPEIIEYAKSRGYTFKKIDDNTPVKHFKIAN